MTFGIVIFPGSNCDHDCFYVLTELLGQKAIFLWHKETDLKGVDCVVLPGGFSYGDYLRSGAVAAKSPIMRSVADFAEGGGTVIGICNGFQILQEAGLLPGALLRNRSLRFICKNLFVRVENDRTPFTGTCRKGEVLCLPIAHMDGSFYMEKRAISKLESQGQVLLRYCASDGDIDEESNPNGSIEAIAAVTNEKGNVCGMMPHPERSAEAVLGCRDGLKIFQSVIQYYGR